jgi:hypothetical protein
MAFSLVLCGRKASAGLTSIAIISSIKIATGIATGLIKTGRDLGGRSGGGKRRSGHEAMFLLFEEFFVELF